MLNWEKILRTSAAFPKPLSKKHPPTLSMKFLFLLFFFLVFFLFFFFVVYLLVVVVFFFFKGHKEWEILRRWFIPKWHLGRFNTYRSSCGSSLKQIPEAKPVVRINVRAPRQSVKLSLLMSRVDLTVKDTEVTLCYPPVGCVSRCVKGVQLLLWKEVGEDGCGLTVAQKHLCTALSRTDE